MKNMNTVGAVVAGMVGALLTLPAHAVPALQVYLPGASYDSAVESWVLEDNTLEVVVAGASTPGWAEIIEDVTLWVAVDEADFLANPAGSVTLEDEFGDEVVANGGAVLGTPGDLDPHGIYPAYYYEFSLADLLVGTAGETVYDYGADYDPQDPSSSGQDTGDLASYVLEFSGFESVHLDLSGTVLNASGSKEQLVVAPYSHDADGYVPDILVPPNSVPVPESGVLALMGTGLLGLAFVIRRRDRHAASMV